MPVFDAHMILGIVEVAIVGGLIGLDRTAVGQFMVSQPIVAGPLVGWMLGAPAAGAVIGVLLELIWVLDMPVGTFVPTNSTVAAISATAIAVLGSPGAVPVSVIGFSLLLTTGIVPLTMRSDVIVRKWNSRLFVSAAAVPGADAGRTLTRAHLSGVAAFFLKSFVLYLVILPVGVAAVMVFARLPESVHRGMSLFVKLLPLLGAALIARKLSVKTVDAFVLIGFMIALVLGWVFPVPAFLVLLMTVVCGWLGARYGERRT